MAFMIPDYFEASPAAPMYETPDGFCTDPTDSLCGPGDESEYVAGWFHCLTAPGYMDCTDWSGPFNSLIEARADLSAMYDCDPDTGDDLPDED